MSEIIELEAHEIKEVPVTNEVSIDVSNILMLQDTRIATLEAQVASLIKKAAPSQWKRTAVF